MLLRRRLVGARNFINGVFSFYMDAFDDGILALSFSGNAMSARVSMGIVRPMPFEAASSNCRLAVVLATSDRDDSHYVVFGCLSVVGMAVRSFPPLLN